MELRELIFEKAEVATLTVNRPKALNAFNREVLEGMARVLREVRHDPAVRVLIVTGAGDQAFVAGADIAAMAKMSALDGLDFSRLGHRVMESFEDLPIPVIAAVNGFALGGGLELAARMRPDCRQRKSAFRTARDQPADSSRASAERSACRIESATTARELIMTGDMFDAKTALRLGPGDRSSRPTS